MVLFDSNSLVLEILKQGNLLSMSIYEQKELSQTLRHYSQHVVSFGEINNLCHEASYTLNKINKKGELEPNQINNLKKIGQLLWDGLLTKQVKDRLKTTQELDLVLSIDEELIDIPWELLYTGEDFLCLKFNLGRLVRTKESFSPVQYRNQKDIFKMLILANPTNDLKSAYLEGLYIKNQFDRARNQIKIDFKSTYIDTLYVKKNLRDYDLVHFAGHGEYDPQNSGWVLSDGRFTTQDILKIGEAVTLPSLVFSNACQSAKTTNTFLMDMDYQKKTYSLASAFLFSGTRHYIGTILKIEDPISFTFAKEFYAQLIKGKSIGECVRLSRLKLIQEYGITKILWMGYLLYGDPSFALFRPKMKLPVIKLKRKAYLSKKSLFRLGLILMVIFLSLSLYMGLPSLNPNTYVLFFKSQKKFIKGNNQEVISICKRVIKTDPLFLAVYPLVAKTYERLGDRESALRYYFEYALVSNKKQDKKNLASSYIGIGCIYQSQGDYPKAFDFYNKAIILSKENKDRLTEAVALRKLAVWYIDKEDYDKALELLMKSSEINRQNLHLYEHRYNLACDYFDIGLVFTNKDDFVTAKEFYNKSRQIFEKLRLKSELSDYYFNLGEICLFEKQYQKALDSYMQGLKIDLAQGNVPSIASDYNMIGELYLEMGNYDKALEFFNEAILVSTQINASLELASVYYNLGLLYKQKGQKDKAKEYLNQALKIHKHIDTPFYQEIKKELAELNNLP